MKYKQGFLGDQLELLVVFFILSLLAVIFYYAYSQIGSSGNPTLDQYMNNAKGGVLSFNGVGAFFIVGSGIALIVSAAFIRSHPAVFVVFFLVQVFFAFICIAFANSWDSIFTNSPLSSAASNFDILTFIMRHFPFVSLGLGIIFAIAIFAKGE